MLANESQVKAIQGVAVYEIHCPPCAARTFQRPRGLQLAIRLTYPVNLLMPAFCR